MAAKQRVQVDITAKNRTRAAFDTMRRDMQKVKDQVSGVRNAIIAAFSVREVVRAADTFKALENRMIALTGSNEDAAVAMDHIRRIANQSRSEFEAVGDLFTKLTIATEELGLSQRQIADATQTISNTFVIAGATTMEAANSARQFAQGMASGALRGDELRSVMENNTILTRMLSRGLGITTGQLKEFGAQGLLTAEKVMPILLANTEATTETIEGMGMTIGQSLTILRNEFTILVSTFERTTGFFAGLSNVISFMANNFDTLLIPAMAALAYTVIPATITAFNALKLAISTNPLGALIVGLTAAITVIYHFRDVITMTMKEIFEKHIPIIVNFGYLVFLKFQRDLEANILFPIKKGFTSMANSIIGTLNGLAEKINSVIGSMPDMFKDMTGIGKLKTIDLLGDPTDGSEEYQAKINDVLQHIEDLKNKKIEPITFMELIFGKKEEAKKGQDDPKGEVEKELNPIFEGAKNAMQKFVKEAKPVSQIIEESFFKGFKAMEDNLVSFIQTGKMSFKSFVDDIIAELIRLQIRSAIIKPLAGMMGVELPEGFAKGGAVSGKTPIIVGEKGPELFVPNTAGQIINNQRASEMAMAGGQGSVNINFSIEATDSRGFDELLTSRKNQIVAMISQAMNQKGKAGLI